MEALDSDCLAFSSLSLARCVTLGKLLGISVPQFSQWGKTNMAVNGVYQCCQEAFMYIQCLAQTGWKGAQSIHTAHTAKPRGITPHPPTILSLTLSRQQGPLPAPCCSRNRTYPRQNGSPLSAEAPGGRCRCLSAGLG